MADNTKDKEMASNMKANGIARHGMNCPVCHAHLSGNRVTPKFDNPKGFSHYDFASALHIHFMRCGHN